MKLQNAASSSFLLLRQQMLLKPDIFPYLELRILWKIKKIHDSLGVGAASGYQALIGNGRVMAGVRSVGNDIRMG